jgi:phosphatidylethanolamine-binding protein (PEBP) family uncharacterized protein
MPPSIRLRLGVMAAGWALLLTACGSTGAATAPTPTVAASTSDTLALSSPALADGGSIPAKYICASRTGLSTDTNPPLTWSAPPAGTAGFVLLMSTVAKDAGGTTTKYNWVLYDIPAAARAIPEANTVITSGTTGTTTVGTPGLTSDGPLFSYSPPCSAAGSGLRTYTFTLYALSARPVFAFNHVPGTGGDGANLAAAIAPLTLARGSLSASYTF